MAKHTKQTNKSNKILKVLSITIGSIIVVIAGVFLAINLTYPGKTPTESFYTTQSSTKSSSTTKESTKIQGDDITPSRIEAIMPDYFDMTVSEFRQAWHEANPNVDFFKYVEIKESGVNENTAIVLSANASVGGTVNVAKNKIVIHTDAEKTSKSTDVSNAGRDYAREPVHGTFANIRETSTYIVWGTPEGIYYVEPKTTNGLKGMTVHEMEQLTFSMGVKDVGNIDPSKVNDIVTGLSVDITQTFKPSAGPVYIYTDNTPAAYTLAQ